MRIANVHASELKKGIEDESEEHTETYRWLEACVKKDGSLPPVRQFARQIAMDHLTKVDPAYYTKIQAAGL